MSDAQKALMIVFTVGLGLVLLLFFILVLFKLFRPKRKPRYPSTEEPPRVKKYDHLFNNN